MLVLLVLFLLLLLLLLLAALGAVGLGTAMTGADARVFGACLTVFKRLVIITVLKLSAGTPMSLIVALQASAGRGLSHPTCILLCSIVFHCMY
jgi:hypothetical protein